MGGRKDNVHVREQRQRQTEHFCITQQTLSHKQITPPHNQLTKTETERGHISSSLHPHEWTHRLGIATHGHSASSIRRAFQGMKPILEWCALFCFYNACSERTRWRLQYLRTRARHLRSAHSVWLGRGLIIKQVPTKGQCFSPTLSFSLLCGTSSG